MNYTSPEELATILKSGHRVIDVRTPGEFRAEHVSGAELHPLHQLDVKALCQQSESDAPLYVICQSGSRACVAAEKLISEGHPRVHVLDGGINAAKSAGVAIVRGKGTISIERQVRIGAGVLVVGGCIAGLVLHTGFFAVPLFVGSGLIFAGVTDFCGMGLMLAKMPWNR